MSSTSSYARWRTTLEVASRIDCVPKTRSPRRRPSASKSLRCVRAREHAISYWHSRNAAAVGSVCACVQEQRRRRMKDQAEKAAPASASSDLLSGSSKRRTEVSGDSLEDDFSFYAGQIEEDEIEDDVTSDTDTKGDTDFVSATTSSSASIIVADDYDDDDDDDDDDDHDDDHDSGTAASSTKQPTQKADAKHHPAREQTSATLSDVAFVLDVPESQQELADLVDTRSPSDMAIILSRVLKSNHPSLGPAENHGKIERYSTLLFQQFAAVAASFVPFAIADHQFASLAAAATAKDALLRLDAIVTTLYQVASLAEDKVLAITKSKLRAMNQALDDAADGTPYALSPAACCMHDPRLTARTRLLALDQHQIRAAAAGAQPTFCISNSSRSCIQ